MKLSTIYTPGSVEISMKKLDKLRKGMGNKSNNCFMNASLQCLLSVPLFYNYLIALGNRFPELSEDGLLLSFLETVRYMDENKASDHTSLYAEPTVNVE